jgi:glyoxylase-like metal-dependent hydrolase (beta-lactamase superfamily II)
MNVGELVVTPVHDGVARFPPTQMFMGQPGKGKTDEEWAPHRDLLAPDGKLELAMGGFLVRSGDRLVLVDTGIGTASLGEFSGGALLASLAAQGVAPEDITDVVFTHLHFDHVGWATQKGEVVFTNATYRCDARDWAHFVGPDEGATRKLTPIEDRLATWDASTTVLPGVDAMVAPGHTPGSTIIVLSSGTARAMLLGDVVHCPVELLDDEWAGLGDVDPELARRTRVALARELEGDDVPVAAAHFPGMQFGRLLAAKGRRQWVIEAR